MTSFTDFLLNYDAGQMQALPTAPPELLEHAQELSKAVNTIPEAVEALNELMPHLESHAPAPALFVAFGILLEKTRQKTKMLESWQKIHDLYPDDPLVLRMMLRWYRRESLSHEGIAVLDTLTERWIVDAKHCEKIILGYKEVQGFTELDNVIARVLERHSDNNRLKYLYVIALRDQGRLQTARTIAKSILDTKGLGPQAIENLDAVMDDALEGVAGDEVDAPGSIIGSFVAPFVKRDIALPNDQSIGQVVFYTGQLGAGGAERQMTRIAAAMKRACLDDDGVIGDYRLSIPPKVCIRDIDPDSGKDFFLPVLQEVDFDTYVLTQQSEPGLDTLNLTSQQRALFRLLPADIRTVSLKLSMYLRSVDAEVVYYWQDGAVLTGAIAALLAGVPRIVASFRGLPPNIRTEFMRPEYAYLYRALVTVPGVAFTANSQAAATAYEEWLDLPTGSVGVLQNGVPDVSSTPGTSDETKWAEIEKASAGCTQTVVGVFRFDHNKRPQHWIKVAAAYARKHPFTRFIVVGSGDEFEGCEKLVKVEKLDHRIFLLGRSNNVGFWMHKADMLMHLARFEGLPNVVIEAQLCKLAVLATPAGGTADVVAHNQTGFILPDAETIDIAEIVMQLEQMLQNPEQLESWGHLGRQKALERFALPKVLADTMKLFRV